MMRWLKSFVRSGSSQPAARPSVSVHREETRQIRHAQSDEPTADIDAVVRRLQERTGNGDRAPSDDIGHLRAARDPVSHDSERRQSRWKARFADTGDAPRAAASPRSTARFDAGAETELLRTIPTDDSQGGPNGAPAMSEDPVVGWLVVMEGPGRGRSVEIGMGSNTIGRSPGQKIRLDFGDGHISRERHAAIVYEPKTRRFFIERGEVRNLVYLNGEVVLAPMELKGGEKITIGSTVLQFVVFCGSHFAWT